VRWPNTRRNKRLPVITPEMFKRAASIMHRMSDQS
jgi:hypothetical protein